MILTAGPRASRMGVGVGVRALGRVRASRTCLLPELLPELDLPLRPSASRPLRRCEPLADVADEGLLPSSDGVGGCVRVRHAVVAEILHHEPPVRSSKRV